MSQLRTRATELADAGYGYEDIAVRTGQPWQLIRHMLRERYGKASDLQDRAKKGLSNVRRSFLHEN